MSHRNTFFFTLAAVLSLLSACSPQPEAPAPETALTAPPELTVTAGNQSCTALRGGWSWTVREGNDQYSGTISDSVHPLECREMTPQLTTAESQALLSFPLEPDTLTAQCWPESAWGDVSAQGEEAAVEGDTLTLNPGGWIYEIRAGWDRMPDFEGNSSYTVLIRME